MGARLREIRRDAGLTSRALAAAAGWDNHTRVSKIEHGVQAPSDDDIRAWCAACSAEGQVPDLIATARAVESAYLEFQRQARTGMKRVVGAHTAALYERTGRFRIYEHNVIPGLFQTAAYCAAMLSFWIGFLETPGDLDAAVAARMERQKVIFSPGKRFDVILEEQALRTWFGTAETQTGQLGRLLEMMAVPTVSLGIIPLMTERSGVPSAGFWIFDDSLAALETPTASIEVTRPQEIELYARMFGHLEASAVRGAAARSLHHPSAGRAELAQQRATSWTGRPPGSYHHVMNATGSAPPPASGEHAPSRPERLPPAPGAPQAAAAAHAPAGPAGQQQTAGAGPGPVPPRPGTGRTAAGEAGAAPPGAALVCRHCREPVAVLGDALWGKAVHAIGGMARGRGGTSPRRWKRAWRWPRRP